jgi:hypothetical protein
MVSRCLLKAEVALVGLEKAGDIGSGPAVPPVPPVYSVVVVE